MLLNFSVLNAALLDGDGPGSAGPHSGLPGSGRYISADDLALLTTATEYAVFARVRVADAAGTMQDYSLRSGINWQDSIEIDSNIDQPIGTATVKLWREVKQKSLAPYRSDSSYNQTPIQQWDVDSGTLITTTGPAIDAGRRITIDVATVHRGVSEHDITDDDWHSLFDGYVDSVDFEATPIVLECRDLGAQLADVWFPVSSLITPDEGDAMLLQVAMQKLLDQLDITVHVDLYVPVAPSPAIYVGQFRFGVEAGIDALVRLAQTNGWDLRYRWSDIHQAWRFTFSDPGRTRLSIDFDLDASMYYDVKQLKIDRTPIRNEIFIWYCPEYDADTGACAVDRRRVNATDGISQDRYFKRSMILQEADDSPINTEESAQLMADLIVFDLSTPIAEMAVEMPFFWPVELHNRIRFEPNGIHHDDVLDVAVVSIKHTLTDTESRTTIAGRTKAAGSYWQWLSRRPVVPGGTTPVEPDNPLSPTAFAALRQTPDYAADMVRFDWAWGGDPSAEFEVFVQVGSAYISQGSVGTTTHFTWSTAADIEPFHTPPDPPQRPVVVSFYLVATVGGVVVATSPKVTESYGFGP